MLALLNLMIRPKSCSRHTTLLAATNLSCKPQRHPRKLDSRNTVILVASILGFGNTVNAIPSSHAQSPSTCRQTQTDEPDIKGTSRADPALPQDRI
jgi:hypothetical protein